MVKAIKAFRCYLVGAIVIAFVPNVVVKDIFYQQEVSGRRCRWINRIQEFDIEIQITKLVRGQSHLDANQINVVTDDLRPDPCDISHCEWYTNVIHYLQHIEAPSHLTKNEKRSTKLQAIRYIIVKGSLWWRNFEGILLKCVDQGKAQ